MSLLSRASKQVLDLVPSGSALVPSRQATGVGYNAASGGRRSAGWNTTVQGVNSILFADIWKLLQRSREQARQNPWAVSALDKYVANAIGNGIEPHPQHPDKAVRTAISEAWKYSNDQMDIDGKLPFTGLQSMICRSCLEGGESFIRMITVTDDDDLLVPLQLRVMETEQLSHYTWNFGSEQGSNIVRMGIEMDPEYHRTVAYHFYSEHPFETVMFPYPINKYIRIPKQNIAHHFKPLRPGQIRGIPWLAPVLTSLFEIDQILDAELARQKTQALFTGFITVNSGMDAMMDETNVTTSDPAGNSHLDTALPTLEPGSLYKLLPGEAINFSKPEGAPQFAEFMRTALYAVSAGMGITYEQLTNDLSGVTYSSIRAGLLEFRRLIESYQYSIFAYQVLRPVWRRWMKTAVIAGVLPFRDYDIPARRMEYESVIWQPPGWDWVDPLKDIAASISAVRSGLDSRDRVLRERGLDPEQVDHDGKIAHDRAVALGHVYESDTSQILQRGETLVGSLAQEQKEQKQEPAELGDKSNNGENNNENNNEGDDKGDDKGDAAEEVRQNGIGTGRGIGNSKKKPPVKRR